MSRHGERPCETFGEAGCGCCEGIGPATLASTPNRPGLSALHYRIGRHAEFLDTMKARLSSWNLVRPDNDGAASHRAAAAEGGERTNPLFDLRTRAASDASIAVLDAWATVADILTFYQERIANEGFLRTAVQRGSIVELARLIGYRPRPGVASSLYLAYTIDENTREEVIIPTGARSQSVPGPDELPQSFETSEPLAARAAWNTLTPRQSHPATWESIGSPDASARAPESRLRSYVKGISSNIKVGDPLLIDGVPAGPLLYRAIEVEPQPEDDRTRLELSPWSGPSDAEPGAATISADIQVLIDAAPQGANASNVVGELRALQAQLRADRSLAELASTLVDTTFPFLEETKARPEVSVAATSLWPWLSGVEEHLRDLLEMLSPHMLASSGNGATEASDAVRLERLARQPSSPLPNATRLPRTLNDNFAEKSDATFKVVGTVRPDLRDTLPTAWSNYGGASAPPQLTVHAFRVRAGVFGHNFPERRETLTTIAQTEASTAQNTRTIEIGEWPIVTGGSSKETDNVLYLDASYEGVLPNSWVALDFSAVPEFADEERQVEPATFAADPPRSNPHILIARAVSVNAKVSRSEYGGSGDTTRILLSAPWLSITPPDADVTVETATSAQEVDNNDFQVIRSTAVYAQSEELELAEQPIVESVCYEDAPGETIELDGFYADLEPGRFVIVSGERTDIPETTGVVASEVAMVVDVIHDVRASDSAGPLSFQDAESEGAPFALPGDRIHTFVRLDKPLAFCYKRDAVTIHANVVKATHGETRDEVLGSGDGSEAFAVFELKQKPLTHIPASTPDGIESTLEVFIHDVRWKAVPDFIERGPREHIYTTRTEDDGRTTVQFGDGHAGARPPTGVENIRARYRTGIGRGGNVRARQVSLLSSRPLGVKEVINPLRASGGADRESRDQARSNAPLAVKALDRLVSVADYADFARTFAGIGKALAAELSDGQRTVVHVTIAGADDVPIDRTSDLFLNLQRALRDFGDPFQPVVLDVRELLLLVIEARLRILEDHQWEVVVEAVRAALLEAFGFQRRDMGQHVARSEIIRVIQTVRGVDWVDLDFFGTVATTKPDADSPSGRRLATPDEIGAGVRTLVHEQAGKPPRHRVRVRVASSTGTGILPAELALLAPDVPATLVLNQIP